MDGIVAVCSILGIGVTVNVGMAMGHNGVLAGIGMAAMAGLGGYSIAHLIQK